MGRRKTGETRQGLCSQMWLCELPEGCPLSEGVAVTPEAGSKGRAAGAEAAILGGGGDMWGGGAYSFPAPLTPPTCLGSQGRRNSMLGPGCPGPCPQAMRETQSVGVCCHVGGAARSTGDLGARGGGWGAESLPRVVPPFGTQGSVERGTYSGACCHRQAMT